jgi:hypothetical protein
MGDQIVARHAKPVPGNQPDWELTVKRYGFDPVRARSARALPRDHGALRMGRSL